MASSCLMINGKVISAAHEERFSRIKCDVGFPFQAINYCIKYERNFKIQLFLGVFSIFLSLFLHFTIIENIVLIATIFSVLILELLNITITFLKVSLNDFIM